MSAERRRLTFALLLSLLIHALLLSLTFGGEGLGLPGFGFPWRERRIEAPDLRVLLLPAQVTTAQPEGASVKEPLLQPSTKQPRPGGLVLTPTAAPAPTRDRTTTAVTTKFKPSEPAVPAADARPEPKAAREAPVPASRRGESSGEAAPTAIPAPDVIAMERSEAATLVEPAAPPVPASEIAAASGVSGQGTVVQAPRVDGDAAQESIDAEARARAVELARLDRLEQELQTQVARQEMALKENARREAERQASARQEAARQAAAREETARLARARLEAERQEAAQQATARAEATRQEAARQESERVEKARMEAERREAARQAAARQEAERAERVRLEAERQETARLEAERQEVARQVAARQEAARQEAERAASARLEAERQVAARQEAARQEAARQDAERVANARLEAERREAAGQAAARQEAARREAARFEAEQEEAKRDARLQAIGRQLNEEAARRDAASTAAGAPSKPLPASSSLRRGRLFGRSDPNVELIRYAEAWARKIELNLTIDMVREALKRPYTNPLVTVAIRSDGSVESVTFVMSSGVAEIDEAIRRVVQSQMPYQSFPPALAREYDVIEIRRTWYFDVAVRLY